MIKLKPCPFCGGEATPVYCENGNQYTSNIMYLSKRGTIKCKHCGVELQRVYSRVSKAIEAWNRRAGKTGHWIPFGENLYQCSNCGAVREQIAFSEYFCPNCGADMREEKK